MMRKMDYEVTDNSQVWSLTKLSRGVEQTVGLRCVDSYGAMRMVGWDEEDVPVTSMNCEMVNDNEYTHTHTHTHTHAHNSFVLSLVSITA